MALFNEILTGRFNRALQKFFSMKGGPPVPQLAGELTPAVSLFWGAECRYLEGWQRYGILNNPAAGGAANDNHLQFRNPTTSTVVAVFEKIAFAGAANDTLILSHGPSTTDLGTAFSLSNTRWDPRGQNTPTIVASTTQAVPGDLTIIGAGAFVPANTTHDLINYEGQEVTLLPGEALRVRQSAVNTQCIFTVWWRERTMEESERT